MFTTAEDRIEVDEEEVGVEHVAEQRLPQRDNTSLDSSGWLDVVVFEDSGYASPRE